MANDNFDSTTNDSADNDRAEAMAQAAAMALAPIGPVRIDSEPADSASEPADNADSEPADNADSEPTDIDEAAVSAFAALASNIANKPARVGARVPSKGKGKGTKGNASDGTSKPAQTAPVALEQSPDGQCTMPRLILRGVDIDGNAKRVVRTVSIPGSDVAEGMALALALGHSGEFDSMAASAGIVAVALETCYPPVGLLCKGGISKGNGVYPDGKVAWVSRDHKAGAPAPLDAALAHGFTAKAHEGFMAKLAAQHAKARASADKKASKAKTPKTAKVAEPIETA